MSLLKVQYNLSIWTVSIKRTVSIKQPVLRFFERFLLKDQYNLKMNRIITQMTMSCNRNIRVPIYPYKDHTGELKSERPLLTFT